MKKTVIATSSILTLLLLPSVVFASSSSVETNIHQSFNSSNNINTQTSSSHSKVTITCNGKTYTYESNGESIDANPCDGSSVKINNNGSGSVQGATSVVTPNPTNIKQQIEDKKTELKKKIDEEKAKIKATITAIPKETTPKINFDLGAWIRSFFASLFK